METSLIVSGFSAIRAAGWLVGSAILAVGALACSAADQGDAAGETAAKPVADAMDQIADTRFRGPQFDSTSEETALKLEVSAPDIAVAETVGTVDAVEPDTAVAADVGCTQTSCSCSDNSQCDSGQCIEVGVGKKCAKLCGSGCDAGFKCAQLATAGGDIVNVCVPAHPRLCEPCNADSDCSNVLGGADSRCSPYKDELGNLIGNFCSTACIGGASDCPGGYECSEVVSLGGLKAKQCIAVKKLCTCDERAALLGLKTACTLVNAAGTCLGKRSCGPGGLTSCDAPGAAVEQCNQADDDCDGQTDEPTSSMCDDNEACTYDNCIGGACQHPPMTGLCKDNDACTVKEQCVNGKCTGDKVVCNDNNVCTGDACVAAQGCTVTADDAGVCSDGNACTQGDACQGGACVPGAPTPCDDANPCTTDSCAAKIGCVFVANALACSDGNICTLADTCGNAVCMPGKTLNCADGNPCTDDSCDAVTGCNFANNANSCSDGNVCTAGDACSAGTCAGGKVVACKDDNPCTDDGCDSSSGCSFVNNTLPCNDGTLCTFGDTCKDKGCGAGSKITCNDGNPCTGDSCDQQLGCVATPNAVPCSDGNVCTENDACQAGTCAPGPAKVCDDGQICTADVCDAKSGCAHPNNKALCDDGSVCTQGDKCAAGLCIGGASANCIDGNPCTVDACDALQGCKFTANAANCDDSNACTTGESCAAGACAPTDLKNCDDGNFCTTDACDPKAGCVHAANQGSCDDGDVCTVADKCAGGACGPGTKLACNDGNGCTDDGCDAKSGCQFSANAAPCSDNSLCTAPDGCSGGTCVPGKLVSCNDGNLCTDDSCAAGKGCLAVANTLPCDDNNACTPNDSCKVGSCVGGAKLSCDDNNVCTDDSCNPKTGCAAVANAAACDDGQGCSGGDVCSAGKCAGMTTCDVNATCVGAGKTAVCKCKAGFWGGGFACGDIDECSNGTATCHDTTACQNTLGGFNCACKPGLNNCDSDPSNGCESTAATDVQNCGGCGKPCVGTCNDGKCVAVVMDKIYISALVNAHQGNLGGLAGADLLCAKEAAANGRKEKWQAFLAGPGRNIAALVPAKYQSLPVFNIKNGLLFSTWSSLFSGANPSFSAAGYLVAFDGKLVDEGTGANPDWADADAYTGASPTGQAVGNDCSGWTTTSGTAVGTELDGYTMLGQETGHPCTDFLAVMCVTVDGAP